MQMLFSEGGSVSSVDADGASSHVLDLSGDIFAEVGLVPGQHF